MFTKIMKVFYGQDNLPYKDQERQVHFPITGGSFLGASNVTEIRFYIDQIGDSSDTWVANAKLPNGKMGSKILQTFTDNEIGEHYAKLDFSSYYTQAKGDVYISLNGFYGGVQITETGGVYSIEGIPTIQATGVVKIAVNYATPLISGDEVETITLQQIFAMFGTKLDKNDNRYLKVVPTSASINTAANQEIISAGDIVYAIDEGIVGIVTGTYPNYTLGNAKIYAHEVNGAYADFEVLNASVSITVPTFNAIQDEYEKSLPTWLTENYVDRSTNQDISGNKTFKGETLFSDNVVFDEDVGFESKVKFSDTIIGGLTPETTNNANIGTSSNRWKNLYLSGDIDFNGSLKSGNTSLELGDIASKDYVSSVVQTIKKNAYILVNITQYPTRNAFLNNYTGQEEGNIYLYPVNTSDLSQGYYQYIWENNAWVNIGIARIDLENYVTTDTDQTITGLKTFDNRIKVNEIADLNDLDILISNDYSLTLQHSTDINLETGDEGSLQLSLNNGNGSKLVGWFDSYSFHFVSEFAISSDSDPETYLKLHDDEVQLASYAGLTIMSGSVRPAYQSNNQDLGNSSAKWRDLYLSGSLKDGTNSVSVANIENNQNKVTTIDSSSTDTQYPSAKCVYDNLVNVREVAEGKCATYILDYDSYSVVSGNIIDNTEGAGVAVLKLFVYDLTEEKWIDDYQGLVDGDYDGITILNPSLNSQNNSINLTNGYLLTHRGLDYYLINCSTSNNGLKLGDILLITQVDVPDRWFSGSSSPIGQNATLYFDKLETSKIDLTNYYAKNENLIPSANNTYNLGSSSYKFKDTYIAGTLYGVNYSATIDELISLSFNKYTSDNTITTLSNIQSSVISLSADRTFALASAPNGFYPEYKAFITNSGASSIVLTFTGITNIITNNDESAYASSNTITLSAGTTIEISIVNNRLVCIAW